MQHHGERRANGVRRVPVERIVDVCPTTVTGSTFQGWSVNVSGRGMSVRATHVPELEAPVVLRFQEHGAEVIAEAVVVWRRKADEQSEFGVRFTALDSRSVQTLKALCQAEALPLPETDSLPEDDEHDTEPAPPAATAAVKLHIEGLAAPMQARVRQQGSRQVALASPLEFLRVGRDVDIEESALGGRRKARIDRVDVDVDPDSHVPELVVSLRYDATAKPPRVRTASPPSAQARDFDAEIPIDSDDDEPNDAVLGRDEHESPALKATVRSVGAALPPENEIDESDEDESDDGGLLRARPSLEIQEEGEREELSDAERVRQRLDGMLVGLSKAARVARQRAEHLGAAASRGARWVAAHADHARRSALAAQRALPRRRTTSAPRSLRSGAPRSQAPKVAEAALRRLPPRRALAAGAIVLTAVAATWIGRASTRSDAAAQAAVPAAAAAPAVQAPAPTIVEEAPPAPSQRPRVLVPPDDGEPEDMAEPAGVVAQVPLFGPTSLDPAARVAPHARAAVPSPRARSERRALARVEANAFEAPTPSSRTKPKASAEFTSGRLRLPTVYRLRLDEPGSGLRGERTPTGFDVIIPGRKTMESGTAITRRDARIAKVTTKNGSDGARVSFRFRSDIPAYKVRLRNDFVEFFISAP